MTRGSLFRHGTIAACLAGFAFTVAGCGEVARTGRAPAFLIIEALEGTSGAEESDEFTTLLMSDVETIVEVQEGNQTIKIPTRFNDSGRVTLRLALKNPGTPTSPLGPTTLNEITVTRYRVEFRRTDGRNEWGVDVPYPFEGGMTVTVPAQGTVQGVFDLVRHVAKAEPPLKNLAGGGAGRYINTVAEVTFFGRDQAGNEATVSGLLSVNFADFGDPK